jgi:hypothetical protein
MRLGQAVCEIATLLSDPEIKIALVPISDAEHQNAIETAASVDVANNEHGILRRDRAMQNAVIFAAAREHSDLTKPYFERYEEVQELEHIDINYLWDIYSEMVANSSPSIDGMSEEEFDAVKKALREMDWNVLSGASWFALKRFLSTITPRPLLGKSPGYSSTNPSTVTNTLETSATDVAQS